MGELSSSSRKNARRLWKAHIRRCRRKNIYWEISEELFVKLTSQNCSYCGRAPAQKSRSYIYNGLDRTNNRSGYTPENVVPCCGECNQIKSNRLTFEEMKVVGQALAAYRKKLQP